MNVNETHYLKEKKQYVSVLLRLNFTLTILDGKIQFKTKFFQ